MTHELVGNEVVATADGVTARCTCGWSSGPRFSGMVASALFRNHQEHPDDPPPPADLYEVAKRVCHEHGMPWTDPRTGQRHPPPPLPGGDANPAFARYDIVTKNGGDYRFDGIVVAAFQKRNGVWRYVVEDDRGILHIFSAANLKMRGIE